MVTIEIGTIELGAGLLVYNFVQGVGYSVAQHYFNRHGAKRFDAFEKKVMNTIRGTHNA